MGQMASVQAKKPEWGGTERKEGKKVREEKGRSQSRD